MLNQTSPSTLIEAWVLVPALVVAASAALGWLLARAVAADLGALTLPAGFLTGVSVTAMLLSLGLSGKATVALVALLALAGAVLAVLDVRRGRVRPRMGAGIVWPLAAFVAVYAFALAPIVGSGRSVVLGYQMNGDSAVHVTLIDAIAKRDARAHRIRLDSVHAATYDLESGYPLGSYAWPLFGRVLTGVDVFHLWSPLCAVVVALMALVGYAILRTLLMPRAFAAAGGALAAVGYLMYSYHGQGGTKEVLMPLAVYGSVALAGRALGGPPTWRALLPATVAAAAAVANLGYGGLAWVGPIALGVTAVLAWRARSARSWEPLTPLAGAGAVALALGLPALIRTITFFDAASTNLSRGFGNLFGAVPFREAFNIWLAHDYRHHVPDAVGLTDVGLWLAAALCVIGGVWALARGNLAVPLSLFVGLVAVAIVTPQASIYFDAKAYVAAAPALALGTAAGVYAVALRGGPFRVAGLALAALLAIGVVASDAYVYSGVWVTPRDRFDELGEIGKLTRGKGRLLVNDDEAWAAYLLRGSMAWTEHAFRSPRGEWAHPRGARPVRPPDLDDYSLRHIETFTQIVDRKSPYGSRPPSNFVPVFETRHYRLWRRRGSPPVFHAAMGREYYLGAAPLHCRAGVPRDPRLRFLFTSARKLDTPLRAAIGPAKPVVVIDARSWVGYEPVSLFKPLAFVAMLGGSGSGVATLAPGRYDIWIAGSLGPGVRVWARSATSVRQTGQVGYATNDMGLPALWQPLGRRALLPRQTILHAAWAGRAWWKASSRRPNVIGPIVLTRAGDQARVVYVPPARATSLCGQRLDWLELGRPS